MALMDPQGLVHAQGLIETILGRSVEDRELEGIFEQAGVNWQHLVAHKEVVYAPAGGYHIFGQKNESGHLIIDWSVPRWVYAAGPYNEPITGFLVAMDGRGWGLIRYISGWKGVLLAHCLPCDMPPNYLHGWPEWKVPAWAYWARTKGLQQ